MREFDSFELDKLVKQSENEMIEKSNEHLKQIAENETKDFIEHPKTTNSNLELHPETVHINFLDLVKQVGIEIIKNKIITLQKGTTNMNNDQKTTISGTLTAIFALLASFGILIPTWISGGLAAILGIVFAYFTNKPDSK